VQKALCTIAYIEAVCCTTVYARFDRVLNDAKQTPFSETKDEFWAANLDGQITRANGLCKHGDGKN
jgi:hypothetical protein